MQFLYACVGIYVHACVCMCTCTGVCCRRGWWVSSVSLHFICGGLLLNPKLADFATLAGLFVLGILSLSPGCWGYQWDLKHAWIFHAFWGSKFSSSYLLRKCFIFEPYFSPYACHSLIKLISGSAEVGKLDTLKSQHTLCTSDLNKKKYFKGHLPLSSSFRVYLNVISSFLLQVCFTKASPVRVSFKGGSPVANSCRPCLREALGEFSATSFRRLGLWSETRVSASPLSTMFQILKTSTSFLPGNALSHNRKQ